MEVDNLMEKERSKVDEEERENNQRKIEWKTGRLEKARACSLKAHNKRQQKLKFAEIER